MLLAAGLYWLSKSHAAADAADAKSADAETDREAAPEWCGEGSSTFYAGERILRQKLPDLSMIRSSKPGKPASPDLRSLAMIHGPLVLRRMVKQLLERRALLHELFAKKPRHTDRAAESGGKHWTQASQRIEQSKGW